VVLARSLGTVLAVLAAAIWVVADMVFRIGAGFRLGRHVWIGASVPLGHHARRLAGHRGHGDADPIDVMVSAVIMWIFLLGAGRWRGDRWRTVRAADEAAPLCNGPGVKAEAIVASERLAKRNHY
jgi:hypothetical protein